jgi:hypothetical protein
MLSYSALTMSHLVRPVFLFVLFSYVANPIHACIDSLWWHTVPVQCNGLRNGKIIIDKVFGGESPYYFSLDGETFSTNPTFDHLWSAEYTLHVRDASGCIKMLPIAVEEPPLLTVQLLTADSTVVSGKTIVLEALIGPDDAVLTSIQWRPQEMFGVQNGLVQQVILRESTNFAVEIADKNGCIARSHLSVQADPINVFVPNVIKPGSAQDAYFTVFAGEGVKNISSLRVYSRGGAKIFEQQNFLPNDPLRGWNGRWDGRKVQSGVYLWMADLEMLDGTIEHFNGTITVVE